MTVSSPDTKVTPATVNGQPITRSNNNLSTNNNDCPNDGTAYLPSNGVVYVQNASTGDTVTGANPFDDLVHNSVTNLTANPATATEQASNADRHGHVGHEQNPHQCDGHLQRDHVPVGAAVHPAWVRLGDPVLHQPDPGVHGTVRLVGPRPGRVVLAGHGHLHDHGEQQRDRSVLGRLQRG